MPTNLKAGDVIFFRGPSLLSKIIYCGSGFWPGFSHVGIMGESDAGLVMFESTSTNPDTDHCVLQGRPVKGVQAHYIEDVLKREDKVWVAPLSRSLYYHEHQRLTRFLDCQLGRGYDFHGAIRSGGLILWAIERLIREEDLVTIFCSELVAAALSAIGVHPTGNASAFSPNRQYKSLRCAGVVKDLERLK